MHVDLLTSHLTTHGLTLVLLQSTLTGRWRGCWSGSTSGRAPPRRPPTGNNLQPTAASSSEIFIALVLEPQWLLLSVLKSVLNNVKSAQQVHDLRNIFNYSSLSSIGISLSRRQVVKNIEIHVWSRIMEMTLQSCEAILSVLETVKIIIKRPMVLQFPRLYICMFRKLKRHVVRL